MLSLRRRRATVFTAMNPEAVAVESKTSYHGRPHGNRLKFWEKVAILTILVGVMVAHILIFIVPWRHGVPDLERPLIPYPYWRALVFNPKRYILAKYWDQRPSRHRRFSLKPQDNNEGDVDDKIIQSENWCRRGYVINLESDSQRLDRFWKVHNRSLREVVRRFPAHQWQQGASTNRNRTHIETVADENIVLQRTWQERYPFLKDAIANGKTGDAACALSHVLLWQKFLMSDDNDVKTCSSLDYLFVFEDDVEFVGAFRANLEVFAPDTADIVFLAPTAFKWVDVPFQHVKDDLPGRLRKVKYDSSKISTPATSTTRVLGGAGAFAYIITREGARKLIEKSLPRCHEPIDLAIMESSDIQIFLPLPSCDGCPPSWPAVQHVAHLPSTRLSKNKAILDPQPPQKISSAHVRKLQDRGEPAGE